MKNDITSNVFTITTSLYIINIPSDINQKATILRLAN